MGHVPTNVGVVPVGEIDELLSLCCEPCVGDEELLTALEAIARHLTDNDLVHRLVPIAARLQQLCFDQHPWAALPAGVAICAIDRPLGRRILGEGRRSFEEDGPDLAVGYAYFLEGLQDLGEGNLASAQRWWKRAHPLLGAGVASRLTSTHLALSMFFGGDVGRAVVLGEEALWAAEHMNDVRSEAVACMDLAMFHLATGRMSAVERHLRRGIAALNRLEPSDRYEMPVMLVLDAVLHTMRDERIVAEQRYVEALADAVERGNRWFEAIAYAVRAEWTATWNPQRAVEDSRRALEYLDSIAEQLWSRTARIAYAIAHLHSGNLSAGRAACETLAGLDLNDLDRGRALLVEAQLAHRLQDATATATAQIGVDLLSKAGANYWAAQGDMVLASIDTRRREFHRRRAASRAGADRRDPAWASVLRGNGTIVVRILGKSDVVVNGVKVKFSTRADLELIAMLALSPHGIDRSVIGDRLWPADDPAKVAHRVDNLVSAVGRQLTPTTRLVRECGGVHLDLVPGECDVRDAVNSGRNMLITDHQLVDKPTVSELAHVLRQPILNGRVAPWILLAQEELSELANRLEPSDRPTQPLRSR